MGAKDEGSLFLEPGKGSLETHRLPQAHARGDLLHIKGGSWPHLRRGKKQEAAITPACQSALGTFAFLPLCSPTKEESEIQREVAGPGLRHRGQQGCGAEGGRGEKPGGWSRSLWTLFWELTDPARARVASLDTPPSPPQTSVPSPEEWSIGKEVE